MSSTAGEEQSNGVRPGAVAELALSPEGGPDGTRVGSGPAQRSGAAQRSGSARRPGPAQGSGPARRLGAAENPAPADGADPAEGPGPGSGPAPAPGPAKPLRPAEGVLSRRYIALTLGIVSVVFLIAFEAMAVGTAMPAAADELNGVSVYAFAFSAFFTTSLVGMVGSGQWCDRRGPLPPLACGIGAFAAGLLLCGTAVTMGVFVVGRAVQGVGGGLVIVALYVTVTRAYPERLRPTVMACFAASWVIPSVVGPLIAGTVTEHLGWRWVFGGIPVLVVVPLMVMLPAVRRSASGPVERSEPVKPVKPAEPVKSSQPVKSAAPAEPAAPPEPTERPSAEPPDSGRLKYALAVAVAVGLLQYAGQEPESAASALFAAAGAALLVPAVLRLMPRGTYRAARGLPAVVLLRGVAAGGFIVAESFAPLMLVSQRGLSVTLAGLTLAAGGATWALGSWTQSRTWAEPYRERLAQGGMVLVAGGVGVAPAVLLHAVPVWTMAVSMAVACFGMGLVISSTSVLLMTLSPPAEAGKNSAALQMSDSLSNVVLLAATGAAFALCGGGAVNVATAGAGHAAAGDGRPLAFVAVYGLAAAFLAVGIGVAGRLRERP